MYIVYIYIQFSRWPAANVISSYSIVNSYRFLILPTVSLLIVMIPDVFLLLRTLQPHIFVTCTLYIIKNDMKTIQKMFLTIVSYTTFS